jgi:hypothetical protein
MDAATTLEAFVITRQYCRALLISAWLLCSAPASATLHVMVIEGLGGETQYTQRFAQWSQKIVSSSATATSDANQIYLLKDDDARRDVIQQRLTALANNISEGDQFVLVLIGHGNFDGNEYRHNIPGPDLTGSELVALLDRLPQSVSQLVVAGTSASGAIASKWSRPYRTLITATRSGGERNATRFMGYWADALSSDTADRDKDGAITAQEAYDYAVKQVAESFKSDAAIVTEHAQQNGKDAARFVLARLGTTALHTSDAQLTTLRRQQQSIEQKLAALKPLREQLSQDEYFDRIEPVLVELARVGDQVDARLAALGAGGSNAKR